MQAYSTPDDLAKEFHDRPIVLKPLPAFNGERLLGDDGKYREVDVADPALHPEVAEEIVDISGHIKCVTRYDNGGIHLADGQKDSRLVLPGEVTGGVYLRRSAFEALKAGQKILDDRYPGAEFVVVDAMRTVGRQASGFTGLFDQMLRRDGKLDAGVDDYYRLSQDADAVFSSVRADRNNPLAKEFLEDTAARMDIQLLAQQLGTDPMTVAQNLLDVAANVRYSNKQYVPKYFEQETPTPLNVDVPLIFSNNAHAGAGAFDGFLQAKGKLANGQVQYDFAGVTRPDTGLKGLQGAMDYMEQPGSLEDFNAQLRINPELRDHHNRLGHGVEITESQWNAMRDWQRVMFHTMIAVGATVFSDTAANKEDNWGAEPWHFEPGNRVYMPNRDGTSRLVYEAASAKKFPDSGNPGHALQVMGEEKAVAVHGGVEAHQQLIRRGLLDPSSIIFK